MPAMSRIVTLVQSALKSYGPTPLKRMLWNREYASDKWDFADHTPADCVYRHVAKYSANGSILDLGCGSGNTGAEMAAGSYREYIGADISEECLQKARRRSKEAGRSNVNAFLLADFLTYTPSQQFDLILFRESLYHVPMGKVVATLTRYAEYLNEGGTFLVRMKTMDPSGTAKARPLAMIAQIESAFDVVERVEYPDQGATVIAFRPRVSRVEA